MISQLVNRLNVLATGASAEYGPKLAAMAADLEHKLESWTSSVDAWAESHFATYNEVIREDAGAAYRAAVIEAHRLIDEVKASL